MNFKEIPGFEGRYEINPEGLIRNFKTKNITKMHHEAKKFGPIYNLSHADGSNQRVSCVKLVYELFGTSMPGWEGIDISKLIVPSSAEAKAAREAKRVLDEAAKEVALAEAKKTANLLIASQKEKLASGQ